MNELAQTALVGIDWGTSSLRAVAMDKQGKHLARLDKPLGIQRVIDGAFDSALEELLLPWQISPEVPIVLSGMVTSRNGWVETPYLQTPATLTSLAQAMLSRHSDAGRPLHFVPGVKQSGKSGSASSADVMRGEETELLGWFESTGAAVSGASQSFVMPGTHSKWVNVIDAKIEQFSTCMTGEVFAALSKHTILARFMATGESVDNQAFRKGVQTGLDAPQSLLASLFSVRALPLLDLMPSSAVEDYLGGLLIGTEVADRVSHAQGEIVVVGRDELANRYVQALEMAGQSASTAQPGSAAFGQLALARMAGLV